MRGNYDNIAWFYDSLSRMVYGNIIVNAQTFLLQFIPANANVLIVGGGTGWILEEIAKVRPSGLKIVYVEMSAKMTAIARKRNAGDNEVVFISEPIETATPGILFDVVITPFLFDNFSQQNADKIFKRIHEYVKEKGIWLYADFELRAGSSFWQMALLKIMYLFFRIFCGIEASRLPDINNLFLQYGYNVVSEKDFLKQFIASRIYALGSTSV